MAPRMSPSLSGLICILTRAIQLTMMGKSQSFKLQTETTRLLPPENVHLRKYSFSGIISEVSKIIAILKRLPPWARTHVSVYTSVYTRVAAYVRSDAALHTSTLKVRWVQRGDVCGSEEMRGSRCSQQSRMWTVMYAYHLPRLLEKPVSELWGTLWLVADASQREEVVQQGWRQVLGPGHVLLVLQATLCRTLASGWSSKNFSL